LEIYSSESISDISKKLELDFNVDRWHRFIWLPWSIGWAIYWNAWCFWLETENNFVEWRFFNIDTYKIVYLNKKELEFSYRNSKLKKDNNLFCISGKFDLNKFEEKYSTEVDNLYFREYKQPKWNSCWSFFKNPKWDSAWRLIEEVWLKWYKIWWAYFSELHANFLMSDWTATFSDLIELKNLAIHKVKEKTWIMIEPEVQILENK
jgi:UDP-N-acetylmuramate dehydrogenase